MRPSGLIDRALLFGASAALLACSARENVTLPVAGANPRVLLVSADPELEVTEVTWWRGEALEVEVPASGALVGFAFPEGSFVDEAGAELDPVGLAAAALGSDPVHPEGCGRCFARAASAPQTLRQGERCPVPVFSEALLLSGAPTREDAEVLRSRVLIEGPGPCRCPRPRASAPPQAVDLELLPASDALGAWPVEAWALHPSGALGLFGEHVARRVGADGARLGGRAGPFVFDGPVMAAAALPGAGFRLWVHTPGEGPEEQLMLELDDELRELSRSRPPIRVDAVATSSDARVQLWGGSVPGAGSDARVLRACAADLSTACVDLSPTLVGGAGTPLWLQFAREGPVLAELFFRETLVFERMVAPSQLGQLERLGEARGRLLVPSGAPIRWRRQPHPAELRAEGVRLAHHGGTLIACGSAGTAGAFALRTDGDFYEAEAPRAWVPLAGTEVSPCAGLEGRGDAILVHLRDGTSRWCSLAELGRCEAGPESALAGEGVGFLELLADGGQLSFSPSRVRRRDQPEAPWRRLYGLVDPANPVRALAASADTLLVARLDGSLQTFEVPTGPALAAPRATYRLPGPPLDVTYTAETETFLVSIDCERVPGPELWRVPRGGGPPEPLDLDGPERCRRFPRLVAAGRGRVVLVEGEDELRVMGPGAAPSAVLIDWDDPETSFVEDRPASLGWRALHAVQGVVYASGIGPALVRLDALHDPERAFAIAMTRPSQEAWNPAQPMNDPELRGLAARCPDTVALGSRGRQRATFEVGMVWRLLPGDPAPAEVGLGRLRLVDEPSNLAARLSVTSPSGIGVRGLLGGDPDWTIMVMSDSLHRVGASWRIRYVGTLTADTIELPGDRFVLGTEAGDLFLGRRLPTE